VTVKPKKPFTLSVGRFARDVAGGRPESEVRASVDAWMAKGLVLDAPMPEVKGPGAVSPLWIMLSTTPPRHHLVWEYIDKHQLDPTHVMSSLGESTLLSAAAARSTLKPFLVEWIKRGLPLDPPTRLPHTALGEAVTSYSAGIEVVKLLSEAGASWTAPHQEYAWDSVDAQKRPQWKPVNGPTAPVWQWAFKHATESSLKYLLNVGVIPKDLSAEKDLLSWFRHNLHARNQLSVAMWWTDVVPRFSESQQKAIAKSAKEEYVACAPVVFFEWFKQHSTTKEFEDVCTAVVNSPQMLQGEVDISVIKYLVKSKQFNLDNFTHQASFLFAQRPSLLTTFKPQLNSFERCAEMIQAVVNAAASIRDLSSFDEREWSRHGKKWAEHYADVRAKEGVPSYNEKETYQWMVKQTPLGLNRMRPFIQALTDKGVLSPMGVWRSINVLTTQKEPLTNQSDFLAWAQTLERDLLLNRHQSLAIKGPQPAL
jgi:hypothetical protein